MFVIDTNLYVRALNEPVFGRFFRAFQVAALPGLWVSAVVLFEILVGASDEKHARDLERAIFAPFLARARILTPGVSTWRLVAAVERKLRARGGYEASLEERSFLNDMLIAASAREVGATVITENARDFRIIRSALGFRFRTSLPGV